MAVTPYTIDREESVINWTKVGQYWKVVIASDTDNTVNTSGIRNERAAPVMNGVTTRGSRNRYGVVVYLPPDYRGPGKATNFWYHSQFHKTLSGGGWKGPSMGVVFHISRDIQIHRRSGSTPDNSTSLGEDPIGTWAPGHKYAIVLDIFWSGGNDGFVDPYVNGTFGGRVNGPNMYTDASEDYAKWGIYGDKTNLTYPFTFYITDPVYGTLSEVLAWGSAIETVPGGGGGGGGAGGATAPIANFTGTPRTGTSPLSVAFTDTSTAGTNAISTYAWTFGDGNSSTARNPTNSYASSGSYDVTHTVTDSTGLTSSKTSPGYVVVGGGGGGGGGVGPPPAGAKVFGRDAGSGASLMNWSDSDFKRGSIYTMPERGTVRGYGARMDGQGGGATAADGAQPTKMMLYNVAGGVPTSLVTGSTSGEVQIPGGMAETDVGYEVTDFILEPGQYHICLHSGNPRLLRFRYEPIANAHFSNVDVYTDGATDPFGTPVIGDRSDVFWAVYDPLTTPIGTTRWYMGSDDTAVSISPAFDSSWDVTAGSTGRYLLNTTNTAGSGVQSNSTETTSARGDMIDSQFVSPALATQRIQGTFKGQVLASESDTGAEMMIQVVVRVVDSTGTVVRGTLVASDSTDTLVSELSTSFQNRRIPRTGPINMTPVDVQAGDRIVIDLGVRFVNTDTTSHGVNFTLATVGGTDLPENETATSGVPWFEFGMPILLQGEASGDFPATSLLSSFTGGDENPLREAV